MSDVTAFLKERPMEAGAIVLAVAVLAYMASRNSGSGSASSTDYAFRGNAAQSIDPNAAAIEEAAIQAGSQNLATIASLAGLQDSNATALTGSLAQTSAQRDVSLSGISAQRDVSLSGIAANLRAALFQTESSRDVSLAQTQAGITEEQDASATALEAARLNDAFNRTALATQQAIATQQQDTARAQIQTNKDIARASDNTSIVNGIVQVAGDVLKVFSWF